MLLTVSRAVNQQYIFSTHIVHFIWHIGILQQNEVA